MVWLKHKGCTTPIIEYIGSAPLEGGLRMRREDWRLPDGTKPNHCDLMVYTCPDCRADALELSARKFEVCSL